MKDICIVGAGIAGITAMKEIKSLRPDWKVTVLSDEDRLPYKRTKISKHIASGFARDDFALLPMEWYSEHGIDLRINSRVREIDTQRQTGLLQDGSTIHWDRLLLAPGAEARNPRIPGFSKTGCFTIRRAGDVESILAHNKHARRAVIVGLGILGVEVSEQLRSRGLDVVALSSGDSIMARDLNHHSQQSLARTFEQNGIAIKFNQEVGEVLKTRDGGVSVISQDAEYDADFAVFAIGSEYQPEWSNAVDCMENGAIRVDTHLATSIEGVFAAGDAVQLPDGGASHLWHAAEAQGNCAAVNICGIPTEYPLGKFRLKCEVFDRYFFSVGMPDESAKAEYQALEMKNGMYHHFYFQGNRLEGVVMFDDKPRAKMFERAVREGWDRSKVTKEFFS